MSHALIARSRDLRRLQDQGYSLRIVDEGYLLVENVPYVARQGDVQEGTLVMELTLSGDTTVMPTTHVAYWIGEFPHCANGTKLLALIHDHAAKRVLSDSIPPLYMLSAKPDGGYRDYHHKVTTYVDILCCEARQLSASATAQQWKVVEDQDGTESVFHYADTASTRQNTTDLARKLQAERVAIVGVGGTGSYVLDLVSKTWVREIHLFDDDPFLQHNAFRSPGPFGRDELEGGPLKSILHAQRYSRMHKGVVPHAACVSEENIQQLATFSTVFLCIDGHPIKDRILKMCMAHDTLLIDVGMGLYRVGDSIAGTLRTTTFYAGNDHHAQDCIDSTGDDALGEYERNAALAVIKWKKARGFYGDRTQELNCEYVIDGNRLINSYDLETRS